jgi:hypothetical protein
MKIRYAPWIAATLALLALACAPASLTPSQKEEADRQLGLARAMETTQDLRRALHMYTIVAETYAQSPQGALAAQRAAMLYARPGNLQRNDSLALYWFRTAVARIESPDMRDQIQLSMFLLDRSALQQQELRRARVMADSLQLVVRRQATTIASQTRRMGEIERTLGATSNELRRLKDVDIQISRSQQQR